MKITIEMTDEVRELIIYLKLHLGIDESEVYRRALSLLYAAAKAEKIVAYTKDSNGNLVEQEVVGIK